MAKIPNNFAQFVGLRSCYTGIIHKNAVEYAISGRTKLKVHQPKNKITHTVHPPQQKSWLGYAYDSFKTS